MPVCCVKSLLQDVLSHGRVVDETCSKADALRGSPGLLHDDDLSLTKTKYENLVAMTQVINFVYFVTTSD